MTERDDKLRRAYRDLAREEPPASLDAAILARSRERVMPRRKPSWMVPVSIAAVLVLGIGVSLRMQMEEPGIETSVPAPATAPESTPPAAPAPPPAATAAPQEGARDSAATMRQPPAKPMPQKKIEAPRAKERTDEFRPQLNQGPAGAAADARLRLEEKPMARGNTTTGVSTEPPEASPAPGPAVQESVQPAPAATVQATPAPAPAPATRAAPAPQAMPLRAKREAESDAAGAQSLRKSLAAPDLDPDRELERIAKLRAEGRHAEADKALEEFRRVHRDFRIPDAMWERVRPR